VYAKNSTLDHGKSPDSEKEILPGCLSEEVIFSKDLVVVSTWNYHPVDRIDTEKITEVALISVESSKDPPYCHSCGEYTKKAEIDGLNEECF
jgi:hypothetical protein